MGYFETYCLACGGPCTTQNVDLQDQYFDSDDRNEKSRLKKRMNLLRTLNLKWIDLWVAVRKDGVIQGKTDSDFPWSLDDEEAVWIEGSTETNTLERCSLCDPNVYGFHSACWNLIGRPSFDELERLKLDRTCNCLRDQSIYSYGSQVGQQQFDVMEMTVAQTKLLNDPLEDKDSAKNICETWNKILLRREKLEKSE